ncbi:hypothetical protein EUGRSUZ_E01840 [Eucalyptus grandis]|uniref:Uncharacterized protein n=2 Tax=Eucalyptus grandis TaxID=71139 RepID=A0ACC3KW71_EUCGR|nr:hypothetical protein EUGRSUZ_E01840 [Eucalyptus grandis]
MGLWLLNWMAGQIAEMSLWMVLCRMSLSRLEFLLVGQLNNSAVSSAGAKLAFKSNEEIDLQVRFIPLDEVIPESEPVLLVKIDGAVKLLSREVGNAPYLIYEEDERLLQASNSSSKEIQEFRHSVGYRHCTQHGTDANCTKNS